MSARPPPASTETLPMPSSVAQELRGQAPAPGRRLTLFVFHRDGVRAAQLEPQAAVVIGRDMTADVTLQDTSLSRRHARFVSHHDGVAVEDLGSTNGTWVAGKRVERHVLRPGEEVMLGSVIVLAHLLSRTDGLLSADVLSSGSDKHDAFLEAARAETVRAKFYHRPFCIVAVRAASKSAGHALRQLCTRLRDELRPVDRLAFYSGDAIEILLPETEPEKAVALMRALLGPREGEPPLTCGVAGFPETATSADELIEVSLSAAREADAQEPIRRAAVQGTHAWLPQPQTAGAGQAEQGEPLTRSPVMRAVLDTAKRLGRSSIPVLLLGETGTGKEVLSRWIHACGPRRDETMVCVNCGAIPAQLLESTLFGHERGAFTGATQQQKGVFEAASGGTVLLDEVGELPLAAQAALLRVLETKRIMRVGSTKEIEVNVRVIAATNRDLEAMCETGTFRSDLLYRLNAMTIRIPPLRARREDIPLLVAEFLEQANRTNDCRVQGIEKKALALLDAYGWPGNVRELRNAIERAVVIAQDTVLTERDLPERVRAAGKSAAVAPVRPSEETLLEFQASPIPPVPASPEPIVESKQEPVLPPGNFRARLERYEVEQLLAALRAADWNQTEAARLLELPLRTLQHKMKALGIKKLGYGHGTDEGSGPK